MMSTSTFKTNKAVHGIIRDRKLHTHGDESSAIARDTRPNPEQELEARLGSELYDRAMKGLRPSEQEILRLAADHRTPAEICHEMGLTPAQERNLKSRSEKRLRQYAEMLLNAANRDQLPPLDQILAEAHSQRIKWSSAERRRKRLELSQSPKAMMLLLKKLY
jgi:DNA-binding CsgD family transcriptional regulator